jgi:hypothetical protein
LNLVGDGRRSTRHSSHLLRPTGRLRHGVTNVPLIVPSGASGTKRSYTDPNVARDGVRPTRGTLSTAPAAGRPSGGRSTGAARRAARSGTLATEAHT